MCDILIVAAIIVVVICISKIMNRECLTVKPTKSEKTMMANAILTNKSLFINSTGFNKAKRVFSWLDAITYEDMRNLIRSNKFDIPHIINVLQ
jgi:hypothetical protein